MKDYQYDTPVLRTLKDIAFSLAKIGGMHFSLYDPAGNVLFQSSTGNRLLSFIERTEKGSIERDNYLKKAIKTTLSQNELTMLRNHTGQHEWFLPLKINDKSLICRIGSFYISENELEEFIHQNREIYRITPREVTEWYKADIIQDIGMLKTKAEQFSMTLMKLLASQVDKNTYEQQFNLIKTIIDITSEFRVGTDVTEIIRVMIDLPLMMMDLDTMSYAQYYDGQNLFTTTVSEGLHSHLVNDVRFPVTGIIEDVITTGDFKYSSDPYDIHRLGIDESIDSIYIFPVQNEYRNLGLLNVYNSRLSENQIEILLALTKITGFVMDTLKVRTSCDRQISQLSDFYATSSSIDPQNEQDELFHSIVNNVGKIANADRVSLMLLEDSDTLQVKAAKGIHRKLASNIRVKSGQPVAGEVFESRTPVMVKDIESEYYLNGRAGGTYKTQSFISIPLMIRDRAIGVINVADKITGNIFSEEDFHLLKSFASHASVLIEGKVLNITDFRKRLENFRSPTV
jgi:GAF domain-containing protein